MALLAMASNLMANARPLTFPVNTTVANFRLLSNTVHVQTELVIHT